MLGIAFLFIAIQLWQDLSFLAGHLHGQLQWVGLSAAALAYGLSHAFRFVRFALLVGGTRLRPLISVYLLSTGASYAIPFKLGEIFRIYWIGRHTANLQRGLIVVWMERVMDASVIILLYLMMSAVRPDGLPVEVSGALIVIPFMIVLSVLMLKVLPENLGNLNLWILQAYRGKQATRRLRLLSKVALFARESTAVLANRTLSLLMLTLCIWGLEIYAIHLLLHAFPQASSTLSAFFGRMISIVSREHTAVATDAMTGFGALQGVCLGVLAILAAAAAALSLAASSAKARR
ncbi:MAG: hypothetical protein EOP38_06380 [Rubrivivax sp.]|nr:MAG: hypothetical protein EOP38_06380 [Rubrivivax sp.]